MKNYNYKVSPDCLGAFIDEGFNQNQIAKCCDLSRQAVNQRIHYAEKPKPFSKPKHRLAGWLFWRNKGFSVTEIAKITDSCTTSIRTRFKKLGIHYVGKQKP